MSLKKYNDSLRKIKIDEESKEGIVSLIDDKTDYNMEKVLAAIKNLEAKIGLVETKLESKIGLVENKIDMVEHKMEGEIAVVNKTINSIYDMNKNLRWYIVTTIAIVGGIISLVIAFK